MLLKMNKIIDNWNVLASYSTSDEADHTYASHVIVKERKQNQGAVSTSRLMAFRYLLSPIARETTHSHFNTDMLIESNL